MTFCIFSQHQSFMDKLAPFHHLNPYSVHKPQTHMPPRSHSPTSISLAMPDTHLFSSSSTPLTSPNFSPSFNPLDELGEVRTVNSVRELHAQILKMPKKGSLSLTTMDGNMIRYYLEFGDFVSAIKVFFVGFATSYSLWNSFLEEFVSFGGVPYEILEVFKELFSKGVEFDSKALTIVLKICLDLRDLRVGLEIHACLIKRGFLADVHLSCALINLYEKCWGIDKANQVFHETPHQESFLWNTIIMANLRSERWENALELFRSMQSASAKAITGTIVKLVQACGKLRALNEGKQIHGYALKFGLVSNTSVCNSIISMYSRNRRLKLARAVFDSMEDGNLSSWNSIISSYAVDGCLNDAWDMIKEMVYSNVKPDIITWNSLLSDYLLQGSFEKVLTSFRNLHSAGFKPDSCSVTSALQAIIELGLFKLGKEIHGYIMRSKLDYDVYVCTSLVDMYVKNDCLDMAKAVFHHTKNKNVCEIPEWKWERITMDFVTGLPRTLRGYDSAWVIVDRLTKSAHFLPVKTTYSAAQYAKLYIEKIVSLHGVPLSIIFDRGPQFTAHFWRSLQTALGTRLDLSTAFHPQTDGQSERTIQILEDMLRACVLDFGGSWDQYLPLMEFAYNNNYQASIQMAPFEALYGRRCRSPIGWFETGESKLEGPDLIQEAIEKVKVIRDRLVTAQSRQKSYADQRRRPLEFSVGEHVFLRVSPLKGILRFGRKGKLSPRFIGPFKILEKVGQVAYRLALPPDLSSVHPVFHVSMLRKCVHDPSHIIQHQSVQLDDNLNYTEQPVAIVDGCIRRLRSKDIVSVKVVWRGPGGEEMTWEPEVTMREKYPHLFETQDSQVAE